MSSSLQTSNFFATFSKIESGISGYFEMVVNPKGWASYSWNINISEFKPSANLIDGGCTKDYILTHGLKCRALYFLRFIPHFQMFNAIFDF